MADIQLYRYNEPLEQEELAFLYKKEEKERVQFYKIIKILLSFCFICPFIIAWFRAWNGVEDPFSYSYYFSAVLFLSCFAGFAVYVAYYNTLRKVQQDIKFGTKTIERTHVTRKQYMPHNNSYYLYLNSPVKLSIEVSVGDYQQMDMGDELNIEYTTYSQLYLGYF